METQADNSNTHKSNLSTVSEPSDIWSKFRPCQQVQECSRYRVYTLATQSLDISYWLTRRDSLDRCYQQLVSWEEMCQRAKDGKREKGTNQCVKECKQ